MDFFPTDVRVRVQGDHGAALNLAGDARNLLFRASLVHQESPGIPVQMTRDLPGGGSVSVFLHDKQKIVTIIVPPVEPKEEKEPPRIFLLCGMIRDGTVYIDPDTHKRYLRSYRPTVPTSTSHNIPNAFHDNERLCPPTGADGSITQYVTVKASMFSGAMKRVVQAVQGLGNIKDDSGYYITSVTKSRYVQVLYSSSANKTHGVIKSGAKNHWLVEISTENGILAMPLPLIPSTKSNKYRSYLARIGDLGGLEVVDEFGGLPSGETFPSGAALTANIANGKILQLLLPADLAVFNTTGGSNITRFGGWAFSHTTGRARNTRVLKRKFQLGLGPGIGSSDGATKPAIVGEQWEIAIALTPHDLTAIARHAPVGVGAASIYMLDQGMLSKEACMTLWVGNLNEGLTTQLSKFKGDFDSGVVDDHPGAVIGVDNTGWGATLWAFFEEDAPKTFSWVPAYLLTVGGSLVDFVVVDEFSAGPPPTTTYTWVYFFSSSSTYSPSAFVGSSLDPRRVLGATYPYGTAGDWGGAEEADAAADLATPYYTYGEMNSPYAEDDADDAIWGIIPAMTRESYAIVRTGFTNSAVPLGPARVSHVYHVPIGDYSTTGWSAHPTANADGWVYIPGFGISDIFVEIGASAPLYNGVAWFALIVNGNANYPAWIHTDDIEYNMPSVHDYRRHNLLVGEEATVPRYLNFIGSMRAA